MERGPTPEVGSSGVTSPDLLGGEIQSPHYQGQNSDARDGLSPVSSRYSSCGESEFERYCSANSVMGTPSLCSSMGFYHDCFDSDFESAKSLEDFSLDGRYPRRFEQKIHSLSSGEPGFGDSRNNLNSRLKHEVERSSPVGAFEGKMELIETGESSSSGYVGTADGNENGLKGVKVIDSEGGRKEDLAALLKNVENVLLQGAVAARSAVEILCDSNHADEMEDERCREQDEASSRYEHSDGDDSMFNYGSDDGSRPNVYYVRDVGYRCDEDAGSDNLVLMNPSVAFGSKDWDDFELDGAGNTEVSQIPDNFWERQQESSKTETNPPDSTTMPTSNEILQCLEQEGNDIDVSLADDYHQGVDKSNGCPIDYSTGNIHSLKLIEVGTTEDVREAPGTCKQLHSNDGSEEYFEGGSVHNIFEQQSSLTYVPSEMASLKGEKEREHQVTASVRASGNDNQVPEQHLDPQTDVGVGELSFASMDVHTDLTMDVHTDLTVDALEDDKMKFPRVFVSHSSSTWSESGKGRIHDDSKFYENEITISKVKDFEMNAFYDEVVHEMEEILLDSRVRRDSSAAKLKQKNSMSLSGQSSPLRDGGSTASVSGLDDGYPSGNQLEIDGIEVVGAKQRKGDISLSERLVGVREYTVYVIRVWSGNDQWEVERRYRDFDTLYRRLKTVFAAQGWILPAPWSCVERASRKFFGNAAPDVIEERSTLIQECLGSILQSSYYSTPPSALIWFLSPPEALLSSRQSNAMVHQSTVASDTERMSTLGKTISLIVDVESQKSVKELLDMQHYTCAGCHKPFENGKTRMQEIVLTFGWGKPRLCEYTGQLFCSSCHTNDTAVLPARVLHHWDFTPYPVSQLAKSYLDSIIDQPMLCVSAANPFLFSKVPTLLQIVGVRRKLGAMLPYIRCSFRRSIYRRLGYRKYLLESNDFFALRDLIDLSKGPFAALPVILEAVLKKIQEHITELCLECFDNGIPCGARQACDNPSFLIFPFQEEEEVQSCKSCKSVFHKHCFDKLTECHCGAIVKVVDESRPMIQLSLGSGSDGNGSSSSLAKKLELRSPAGFLSGLFSTAKQEKKGHKENDNIILMGSLPSTSL